MLHLSFDHPSLHIQFWPENAYWKYGRERTNTNATYEKAKQKKHWKSEKIPTQCGAGQPAAYEVYTVCIHKRRAYSFFLASPYCVLQSL